MYGQLLFYNRKILRNYIRSFGIQSHTLFRKVQLISFERCVSSKSDQFVEYDYDINCITNKLSLCNILRQSKIEFNRLDSINPVHFLNALKNVQNLENITSDDVIAFTNVAMLSLYRKENIINLKNNRFYLDFHQHFEPFINELSSVDLVSLLIASNATGIPLNHRVTTKIIDEILARLKAGKYFVVGKLF